MYNGSNSSTSAYIRLNEHPETTKGKSLTEGQQAHLDMELLYMCARPEVCVLRRTALQPGDRTTNSSAAERVFVQDYKDPHAVGRARSRRAQSRCLAIGFANLDTSREAVHRHVHKALRGVGSGGGQMSTCTRRVCSI